MNLLVLQVDDERDVEVLFRQRFRCDLHAGRFTMEFAQSAPALARGMSAFSANQPSVTRDEAIAPGPRAFASPTLRWSYLPVTPGGKVITSIA